MVEVAPVQLKVVAANTNAENHTTFVGSAVEAQFKRCLSNKPLNLTVSPGRTFAELGAQTFLGPNARNGL